MVESQSGFSFIWVYISHIFGGFLGSWGDPLSLEDTFCWIWWPSHCSSDLKCLHVRPFELPRRPNPNSCWWLFGWSRLEHLQHRPLPGQVTFHDGSWSTANPTHRKELHFAFIPRPRPSYLMWHMPAGVENNHFMYLWCHNRSQLTSMRYRKLEKCLPWELSLNLFTWLYPVPLNLHEHSQQKLVPRNHLGQALRRPQQSVLMNP
jgi:hypothetical protein